MTMEEILSLAKECGFTAAAPLDVKTLQYLPEVRDMCAADRCHCYNKTWSCPPAAGTLDELQKKCAEFSSGILVQTVGTREDEFDFETIEKIHDQHEQNFVCMTKALKARLPRVLPMGIGVCKRCETCTWPDAPCRFPDEVYPPMEAYGMLVSQVCQANGLPYYYGKDGISFTSCFLFQL